MARLAFCDYHNMIAILEKYEHKQDFHQIVDFVGASHIRIETTEEGTKILATVDGKLRTVSESSIRRNLKLNDEAGISSLPNADLFENLQLMGYNILPNQKFTFQKEQFSHQWKYLIHTIMPCLSPKSTGFNEFSINIATALVCLATNRVYDFSKMIFDGMGEGSGIPTESHHTPTSEASPSSQHERNTPRIAQSSVLPHVADEPASPLGDDSKGKACPTDSSFKADQDRANIAKTSTLPSDLTPRVTSFAADEGRGIAYSGDDALIKGRSLDEGEEAAERVSDDTEEMATILSSMDATSILTNGGVQVVPTATVSIPTGSGVVSTASPTIPTSSTIFTTATETTPYTRRKGKETVVESGTPKKKKIARDAEIARIHVEEELQMLIDGLDRNNETIAKKQQKEFYISVLKNHAGWKARHFKGMTLEEIKEKFDPVWKHWQDFIPIGSKEEAEKFKRKGLRLEQENVKKLKTSEEVKATEEVTEEKVKEMMQLNLMHASVEWKLYETCRVHHVTSKDKEIFMLVEKDYPLRKGLEIGMISYKLQMENYSQMAHDLILNIYKIAGSPRQQDD
uniref:Synaptobrevin, longin-like domain protein n=1 Tax=Tanacetum cinerariifolium TaxID=118510 RepID=A0A699GZR9_TANCI|nr:hypothetical protein [Tanacetum cinerariifolium]